MNRRIRFLAVGLLVIYAALFVQLNRVQVFEAEAYNDRPDNNRPIEADFNRERGTISTIDGKLLAFSEETGDGRHVYQRRYPTGQLFAHVTGSYSFLFGATGAERQYNDELSGGEIIVISLPWVNWPYSIPPGPPALRRAAGARSCVAGLRGSSREFLQ